MAKKEEKAKNALMLFSAVDPYVTTNIVNPDEKEVKGYDFISWGANNDYPDYLLSLYKNVPVLQSLINGCVDYTCGDGVKISVKPFDTKINDQGETIEAFVKHIAYDYWTYGAFAINVVRNKLGGIAGLYYLDVKNVRSDKKNERYWYATNWGKSYGRVKGIEYPKYDIQGKEPSSILYVKNSYNTVYGLPAYGASVMAAEILRSVDEYHLNSINNGFMASYIINFNNGQPLPEIQEEIEDELNEKFSGYQNASRLMVAFNKSKDNAVTIEKLEQGDSYGDRYKALVDWAKEQLFTSFRAQPVLFGIPATGTGFNDQDVSESYKLFNRTMIRPVQRIICDAFKAIFGEEVLTVEPFTVDFEKKDDTEKVD